MTGGLDLLIVGIAGENLDHIAPEQRLRDLFETRDEADESEVDRYVRDFHALGEDPTVINPRIFYLAGEHLCGSQLGAALGYVIFDGNYNTDPRRLDERIFGRIDALKQLFLEDIRVRGLAVSPDMVGVYALNVCDT